MSDDSITTESDMAKPRTTKVPLAEPPRTDAVVTPITPEEEGAKATADLAPPRRFAEVPRDETVAAAERRADVDILFPVFLERMREAGLVFPSAGKEGPTIPEEATAGTIDDRDIPYIAGALTAAQFAKIAAMRSNNKELEAFRARGVLPGTHWIVEQQFTGTIDGKPRQIALHGSELRVEDLSPDDTEYLRKHGMIRAPGETLPARG